MCQDMELYYKTCIKCNKRRNLISKVKGPFGTVQGGFPNKRVAIDILGPLPETDNKSQYILAIMDYFIKYVESLLWQMPCSFKLLPEIWHTFVHSYRPRI